MALSLRTGLSAREAARIPGKPIAMVDSSGEWDGAILFVHTAEQLAEMGERRPPSPRMADSDDDGDDGSSDSGSERAGHGRERRRGRVGRGAPYAAALEEAVRDAGGSDAVRRLGLLRAAGRMAAAPVRDPRAKKLSKLLRRMDPPARRTGRTQREIHLPPGAHFTPLPSTDPKARDIFYVTGPSGCGKSTWAMNFARNYYRWWGGSRPTFLISKLPADEVMDGKEREGARARAERPTRIDVRELLDKPFDWRGLGASLVIFDDCDTFTGAEEAAMQKLQDEIATLGRHETISMLVLSHLTTNYKKTRVILLEAHGYVVFTATPQAAKSYLLRRTIGMSESEVTRLREYGRWALISKNVPLYILGENSARAIV